MDRGRSCGPRLTREHVRLPGPCTNRANHKTAVGFHYHDLLTHRLVGRHLVDRAREWLGEAFCLLAGGSRVKTCPTLIPVLLTFHVIWFHNGRDILSRCFFIVPPYVIELW